MRGNNSCQCLSGNECGNYVLHKNKQASILWSLSQKKVLIWNSSILVGLALHTKKNHGNMSFQELHKFIFISYIIIFTY